MDPYPESSMGLCHLLLEPMLSCGSTSAQLSKTGAVCGWHRQLQPHGEYANVCHMFGVTLLWSCTYSLSTSFKAATRGTAQTVRRGSGKSCRCSHHFRMAFPSGANILVLKLRARSVALCFTRSFRILEMRDADSPEKELNLLKDSEEAPCP